MNFPRRDIQRNDTSPGRNRMHSLFSLVILSEEVERSLPLLLSDLREQKFPKYVTEQLLFLYPRTPQLL